MENWPLFAEERQMGLGEYGLWFAMHWVSGAIAKPH